jgi:membrane peptidoglycan carboxypeptidase
LSTAVWIGNVIPADEQTRRAYTLNGKCFGIYRCQGNVFGGTIAAPVWGKIMAQASEGMPVVDFTNPSPTVVNGEQVTIPRVAGMTQAQAIETLRAAGFTGYVRGQVSSSVRRGLVAGTNPSGKAVKGSAVGIMISSGPAPAPDPEAPPAEPPPTAAGGGTGNGNGNSNGNGNGNGHGNGNGPGIPPPSGLTVG